MHLQTQVNTVVDTERTRWLALGAMLPSSIEYRFYQTDDCEPSWHADLHEQYPSVIYGKHVAFVA